MISRAILQQLKKSKKYSSSSNQSIQLNGSNNNINKYKENNKLKVKI
jgi:hypothetical protein